MKKTFLNPHFIEKKLGIPNTIEIVRYQGNTIQVIFKDKAIISEDTKTKILELINTPQYEVIEEKENE